MDAQESLGFYAYPAAHPDHVRQTWWQRREVYNLETTSLYGNILIDQITKAIG